MRRSVRVADHLRCLAVVAATLALGCAQREVAAATEAPPKLPVASPEIADVTLEREYVAEIRAVRHAELRARVKGILESVTVDEGQAVKAGQTLFTVNARALEQEVRVARAAILGVKAELEAAEREIENTKLLRDNNVVSTAELALSESKVQALRARLEEARANAERAVVELGFAKITSPFDGVVNRIPRRAGSALAEDELLTSITDTSEVFAYFRITEREYLEYLASAAAETSHTTSLRLVDGSVFPVEGVVDAIANEFDRATGTLTYRARFANPDGTLKHGSSGKVILRSSLADAVLVPQRATFDVQGDVYVYGLDEANVARARKLGVTARVGDAFVVESGIERGERFVLEGVQKVRDGVRIDVTAPPEPTSSLP